MFTSQTVTDVGISEARYAVLQLSNTTMITSQHVCYTRDHRMTILPTLYCLLHIFESLLVKRLYQNNFAAKSRPARMLLNVGGKVVNLYI